MADGKAVCPNELTVELLKLERRHDPTLLREFRRVIKMMWREGKVSQNGGEIYVCLDQFFKQNE